MGLVQHDAGVGRHLGVDQGFSEQHSVRHVLNDRLVAEKQNMVESFLTQSELIESVLNQAAQLGIFYLNCFHNTQLEMHFFKGSY